MKNRVINQLLYIHNRYFNKNHPLFILQAPLTSKQPKKKNYLFTTQKIITLYLKFEKYFLKGNEIKLYIAIYL